MLSRMDKPINDGIRAIVFDFNGVIVDDEPIHFEATKRVLGEIGIEVSRSRYNTEFLGCNDRECLETAIVQHTRKPIRASDLEEIVNRKSQYYFNLTRDGPPFVPGAIDFIRQVSGDFSLAIASGALRIEIEHVLAVGGLTRFFSVIISADDVSSSKPDPEGFNSAIAALDSQLRPGDCVAIEDSSRGIRAAKLAGMKCLALTTTLDRSVLSEADWILDSFPSPEALPWNVG